MIKHFFILLLIMVPGASSSIVQQKVLSASDEQVSKHIGMSTESYLSFYKGIKQFNKRLLNIIQDTTLTKEQWRLAVDRLHKERLSYVQKHLNADQQKKFQEFERTPPAEAMAEKTKHLRTKSINKGQAANAADSTIQN